MRASISLVVLVTLLTTALADHWGDCETASPEVTTPATGASLAGDGPGIYYVDNDMCQPDCLFSVWVYEETNGEPGLQRGDEIGGCENADTIIL